VHVIPHTISQRLRTGSEPLERELDLAHLAMILILQDTRCPIEIYISLGTCLLSAYVHTEDNGESRGQTTVNDKSCGATYHVTMIKGLTAMGTLGEKVPVTRVRYVKVER
jgi:hypothetical protein